jgi:hypothetical protein
MKIIKKMLKITKTCWNLLIIRKFKMQILKFHKQMITIDLPRIRYRKINCQVQKFCHLQTVIYNK